MIEFDIYTGTDAQGKPTSEKRSFNPDHIVQLAPTHDDYTLLELSTEERLTILEPYATVMNTKGVK